MNNIRIRQLTPEDIEKIRYLLRTRDELDRESADQRTQLFEWLALKNPYAGSEPTYFVAEDRGHIVALLGRMPTEFVINGKIEKGYFIHDLFVHPEYRKKGMGFFLSMSLYKAIEDSTDSFCCLVWTSALNLEFQRRRGYYELWAGRYVKLLNPAVKLRKFLKPESLVELVSPILKIIVLLADSILFRLNSCKLQVSKIDRFDSRFDNLNQRVLSKIGICSLKTSTYLNWKYIDRPFSKMEVFAAGGNGQVMGFVVVAPNVKKDYPEGSIVDIMADPNDTKTISALLRAAITYFKEKEVYSIECCLSDKRFLKILRRFFFMRAFRGESVMLANLEKFEEKDYLMNINNWHLTYGDSDEFMLRP